MKTTFKWLLVAILLASALAGSVPAVAQTAQGEIYEVVYPMGRTTAVPKDVGASVPDLNGKTVCELWNGAFRGDETFPILETLLKKQYPTVKIVSHTEFGNTHPPDTAAEDALMKALPDKLKKAGCNVVISGNGG